jgi:hypothetical protein
VPRGNDAEAAAAELSAKVNVPLNAEEMIEANAARMTKELRVANLRPVDQEATDELGEDGAQKLVGDDAVVLGYAVRGPFVVVVSEDEDGRTTKQAFVAEGKEKQAERAAPPEPEPEPETATEAEAATEAKEEHHTGRRSAAATK